MEKYFLIFFGPPGSGKGTQIERISDKLSLPVISTGALFRREIKNKSKLGAKIEKIVKAGGLVSDDIVNKAIAKRLNEPDVARGAIFDGYPRNLDQQKFLTSVLKDKINIGDLILAILIDVSDEAVLERLGGRLTCACGATYHIKNKPPKVKNICDDCGGALYKRGDDKPEVINKRLAVYHKAASDSLDYFRQSGNLITVNGDQPIDNVYRELTEKLKPYEIIL